jgi:hypothetical protein
MLRHRVATRRAGAIVFAIVVSAVGCRVGTFLTPTNAVIARFEPAPEGSRFRACTVYLGWTEDELREECGQPIRAFASANGKETCLAYLSVAHAMASSNTSAPYFMVCTEEVEHPSQRKKSKTPPTIERRVVAVHGVSAVPIAGTATTATP